MKSQSNFGKLAIKYKIGLRLLFFTAETQNIWHIVHCILHGVFQGWNLREEKNKYVYARQKIYGYPSNDFSNQPQKVLPLISGLRICWSSRKFGHEMKLKGSLYLALLDRLKAEVNFFIREFLKSFTFLSDFHFW